MLEPTNFGVSGARSPEVSTHYKSDWALMYASFGSPSLLNVQIWSIDFQIMRERPSWQTELDVILLLPRVPWTVRYRHVRHGEI